MSESFELSKSMNVHLGGNWKVTVLRALKSCTATECGKITMKCAAKLRNSDQQILLLELDLHVHIQN